MGLASLSPGCRARPLPTPSSPAFTSSSPDTRAAARIPGESRQPAYQGAAGQQAAGSGTGAMNAYPAATAGQQAAFPASTGYPGQRLRR